MSHVLDLTGDDIAQLDDSDFRALVARLCEAELVKQGLPPTAVTWSGDQNAADGGLDVRVSLPAETSIRGFVPRPNVGFQVKHSNMTASAIVDEMRPGGTLRPFIADLARLGGAYIIACAQGSVTESALARRREAMSLAVADQPEAQRLHLDFYDRGRSATCVRDNPSVIPWLREKLGRPLRGWHAYGNWPTTAPADGEYIVDDACRFTDRHGPREQTLTVVQGMEKLRAMLGRAGAVVRLVGLSGTGKTRLVQALFDARVGRSALPPTHAVYCDFADEPVPTPAEMIQQLKQRGSEAVVVVDNCPPDAHRVLTAYCRAPGGSVSLLTVEFDVSGDDPDATEVFRLETASDGVIEKLLRQRIPQVSEEDRRRIAQFSGGNARIALALGASIHPGDSVSNLADRELFKRLFEQRQGSTDELLRAAEAASLVYSFNIDTAHSPHAELVALAELAEMTVGTFLRHLRTLEERDLVQCRGVWRALLPQALAVWLARDALSSLPRYQVIRSLLQSGCPRLTTSFTRRLGALHDCEPAQALVRAWLEPGGRLGAWHVASFSLSAEFENVAPVAPGDALAALERWSSGPGEEEFLAPRATFHSAYVRVLADLAYDPALFAGAGWVLALMAVNEPADQRHNGARRAFGAALPNFPVRDSCNAGTASGACLKNRSAQFCGDAGLGGQRAGRHDERWALYVLWRL